MIAMRIQDAFGPLRRPALVVASVGVLAGFAFTGTPPPQPIVSTTLTSAPAKPTPPPTFAPTQMQIPAIGMQAPIVPTGLDQYGAMGTPSNAIDVTWWNGVKPGRGNALFAAHHDWSGAQGSFYYLKDLSKGDRVIVQGPDGKLQFRVTQVVQVKGDVDATTMLGPQGNTDLYGPDGAPVVTLITCGGVFDTSIRHHIDRVVARAVLDGAAPTAIDGFVGRQQTGTTPLRVA
jgi:sortase (surface protein transpeptidase)